MDALFRPEPTEYAPYYGTYVGAVPDGDVLEFLAEQATRAAAHLGRVETARETHRYAPGKWSVREVVGHMSDTERVFAYRLLTFARGDRSELPGMDQDVFMAASGFHARPLASIASEFSAVRESTLALVRSLAPGDADRVGVASGHPVSVRALTWIIAGHAEHHLNVLADRYGV